MLAVVGEMPETLVIYDFPVLHGKNLASRISSDFNAIYRYRIHFLSKLIVYQRSRE